MFGSAQKISPLHGKANYVGLSSNRQISGGIAVHDMGYPISNKTPYLWNLMDAVVSPFQI